MGCTTSPVGQSFPLPANKKEVCGSSPLPGKAVRGVPQKPTLQAWQLGRCGCCSQREHAAAGSATARLPFPAAPEICNKATRFQLLLNYPFPALVARSHRKRKCCRSGSAEKIDDPQSAFHSVYGQCNFADETGRPFGRGGQATFSHIPVSLAITCL